MTVAVGKAHLLVVDDDPDVLELLDDYFTMNGYTVTIAVDGKSMRRHIAENEINLIILDLNLPDGNGLDLAREIRRSSRIPIIMLTGRGDEIDRVVGLEMGADDYVAKPFSHRELLARVSAVLRRASEEAKGPGKTAEAPTTCEFCGWTVDLLRKKLFSPSEGQVKLTTGEYIILVNLLKSPHDVVTREELLDSLGKDTSESLDRSIDVHITRLRRKIEPDPRNPSFIKTHRGVGYVFDESVIWR